MTTVSTRVIAALCLLSASLVARPASAGVTGTITGTVVLLKSQDTPVGNPYFQLNSTVHVGACIFEGGSNRTLVLIPDGERGKQMFAMIQGALLAGKKLSVDLDDAASASNYCFARSVTITP